MQPKRRGDLEPLIYKGPQTGTYSGMLQDQTLPRRNLFMTNLHRPQNRYFEVTYVATHSQDFAGHAYVERLSLPPTFGTLFDSKLCTLIVDR